MHGLFGENLITKIKRKTTNAVGNQTTSRSLFRFVRRAQRKRKRLEKELPREILEFARPSFSRGFLRAMRDGQSERVTTRGLVRSTRLYKMF